MSADGAPSSFVERPSVTPSGEDGIDVKLSEPNSFFLPISRYSRRQAAGKPEIGTGPFKVMQSRRASRSR